MSFKLVGLNIEKLNNSIIKAFNKGVNYKGEKISIETLASCDEKRTLICFGGHCLYSAYSGFIPFNLESLSNACNTAIEYTIRSLTNCFNSANEYDSSYNDVTMLFEVKQDGKNIVIFGNDVIKVGVNKDYLQYINLDNVVVKGSKTTAPLKFYDRGELVAFIMPIRPHSGTWEV